MEAPPFEQRWERKLQTAPWKGAFAASSRIGRRLGIQYMTRQWLVSGRHEPGARLRPPG